MTAADYLPSRAPGEPALRVSNLIVKVPTQSSPYAIVDGVDFEVPYGTVFGIAGESGSGKTISMKALLGMLPRGWQVEGTAVFQGRDLLKTDPVEMQRIRGRSIALVQQDPIGAFHPMLTIEDQLTDHVKYHLRIGRREARSRALELLRDVRIPDPSGALTAYPHQFSGGMLQRIAIAAAIACEPTVLIADEPTTGLDVTVQAGVLRLLSELMRKRNLTIVLITHDLGVMAAIADRVAIFYAGRVAEIGSAEQVLHGARHPYTHALLDALPKAGLDRGRLRPIPGTAASALSRPRGCAFHPRCHYSNPRCQQEVPPLREAAPGHEHACLVDPFARDQS